MSKVSNFPVYFDPAPLICSRGHTVSPNGDYEPKGCPTCSRGRPAPRQDSAGWRETMKGVARS